MGDLWEEDWPVGAVSRVSSQVSLWRAHVVRCQVWCSVLSMRRQTRQVQPSPQRLQSGKATDSQTPSHKIGLQVALRGHREGDRRSRCTHLTLYFRRRYFPRGTLFAFIYFHAEPHSGMNPSACQGKRKYFHKVKCSVVRAPTATS